MSTSTGRLCSGTDDVVSTGTLYSICSIPPGRGQHAELLEQQGLVMRGDARPGVLHADHQLVPGAAVGRAPVGWIRTLPWPRRRLVGRLRLHFRGEGDATLVGVFPACAGSVERVERISGG